MLILGCDPSLTDHGWSVVDYSNPTEPIIKGSGRIKTKADELMISRYQKHWDSFEELLHEYQPDYVGFEIPPPNASWSAGLYPIWVRMAAFCVSRRLPYATWMPSSVKAYARDILNETGKMYKSDMVAAAKTLFTTKGRLNHNIADSLLINHLSFLLTSLISGEIKEDELTDKERYLFTRTQTTRKTGKVEKLGMIYKEGDMYFNLQSPKYDYLYVDK